MSTLCAVQPQLDQVSRFLDMMAEGEPVTFQTFDDNADRRDRSLARKLHGYVDEHLIELQRLNARGAGIFWCVNFTDGNGREAGNVTGVRALFLDLDGPPLQPVLDAGLEPHAVVESSPGKWHVYWLVADCPLDRFTPLQAALAARFGGDRSVKDLPRVLRVPGFVHNKNPDEPFISRIVSLSPFQPYALDGLVSQFGLAQAAAAPPPPPPSGADVRVAAGGRHEHLRRRLADMNWRGIPEVGIRASLHEINERECDPPKTRAEVEHLIDDWLKRYEGQHGRDQGSAEAAGDHADEAPLAPLFVRVDLSGAELDTEPAPQAWAWVGLAPAGGNVTVLGGHGGAGKSQIGLMLAACTAAGRDCLGHATTAANVCFFSGEDPADVVRRRLARIIRRLDLPAAEVLKRLHVLDANEGDPALYAESRVRDQVISGPTRTYDALREYVEQNDIGLLVVDNASDCFDGNEIRRASVRTFMRLLAKLVRRRGGAVLLLVHVDKSTAKGLSSESYSGSTAWHNSARSRLFLKQDKPGQLELSHEKCNLGPRQPTVQLEWPEDGLPQVVRPLSPVVQGIQDRNDVKAVLGLIHEFAMRGESVSPEPNSRSNAHLMLSRERGFPAALKRSAETQDLLRDAQRDGLVCRDTFKGADRKPRERWALTDKGRHLIGVAASAASAASPGLAAGENGRAEPAASAASSPPGGVGESPRAHAAAETPRRVRQAARKSARRLAAPERAPK